MSKENLSVEDNAEQESVEVETPLEPEPVPEPAYEVPGVSVGHLNEAARSAVAASKYAPEVFALKRALNHLGLISSVNGLFDSSFRTAYRDWQIESGFTGGDADGYPGVASLQLLASRMPDGLQFQAGS